MYACVCVCVDHKVTIKHPNDETKTSRVQKPIILHLIANGMELVFVSPRNRKRNHGGIVCVSKHLHRNMCNHSLASKK